MVVHQARAKQHACGTGDCAVASSFVSYVGPFNREFRELLLARDFVGACLRMRIPSTPDLKVSGFLAEEAEVGEWVIQARLVLLAFSFWL